MSTALRTVQWIGLALVAVSAAMPSFAWRIGTPGLQERFQPGTERIVLVDPPGEKRVPAPEIGLAISEWAGGADADRLWVRRPIYTYALLPIWVLALLLARRQRRTMGAILWLLTLGIIVLEARYLESDYKPFFPHILGGLETGVAWCVVCIMLLYRRPADRHLGAVESSVAAHGLLALVHGLTLPASVLRDYAGLETLSQIYARVTDAFAPGFWLGMLGFLVMAVPGYVGRRMWGAGAAAEVSAAEPTASSAEAVSA